MTQLHLPQALYQQIRTHAEQAYPNECCGVLLGHAAPTGWRIEIAIPAANASNTPHNHFQIAPGDLVRIDREARLEDLAIAGFYHSHPDHPAHWSQTDFIEAHWLGCCYVILEVAQGKAAQTNAFLLAGDTEEEKRFEQQSILVGG